MALILTVEDGSNVPNSDSYATLDQIKAFNLSRGTTLPADDDAIVALAHNAMDYLQSQEVWLAGERVFGLGQSLAWPRVARVCYNAPPILLKFFNAKFPANAVPVDFVRAQCYLVGIAQTVDLSGNIGTSALTKESIGPLDFEYDPTHGASGGPLLPVVTAMLTPYYKPRRGMLTSGRV